MDDKKKKEMDEIREHLKEKLGEEQILKMQEVVHRLGIMMAIRNLKGSKDFQAIAEEMHKIKEKILPVEAMKEIVEEHYSKLVEEGMIEEDGSLSSEANAVVEHYERELDGKQKEQERTSLIDLPFSMPNTKQVKEALKKMGGNMFCITPWYSKEEEEFGPAATACFAGKTTIGALKSYLDQGGLGGFQLQGLVKDQDWNRIRDEWTSLRHKQKDIHCFKIDNLFVTVRSASMEEMKVNFGSVATPTGQSYAAYCMWVLTNRDRFGFNEEKELAEEMLKKYPETQSIKRTYPCFLPDCNESFESFEDLEAHARNIPHVNEGKPVSEEFIELSLRMIKDKLFGEE